MVYYGFGTSSQKDCGRDTWPSRNEKKNGSADVKCPMIRDSCNGSFTGSLDRNRSTSHR